MTRPVFERCLYCWWLPFCLTKNHPSISINFIIISFVFKINWINTSDFFLFICSMIYTLRYAWTMPGWSGEFYPLAVKGLASATKIFTINVPGSFIQWPFLGIIHHAHRTLLHEWCGQVQQGPIVFSRVYTKRDVGSQVGEDLMKVSCICNAWFHNPIPLIVES